MSTDPPFRFGEAFDPEATNAMAAVVEEICEALGLGITANAHGARQVIAARVVELARRGERDPARLRDRILHEAEGRALA
jgi:hypothetical protein